MKTITLNDRQRIALWRALEDLLTDPSHEWYVGNRNRPQWAHTACFSDAGEKLLKQVADMLPDKEVSDA